MSDARSEAPLEPPDLGLLPGDPLPFEFTPARVESPLLVSFPHVGLEWPEALGPPPQVNYARNADLAIDGVFAPALERQGIGFVRARFSRLVVDLNRPEDDVSADAVPDHPAPNPRTGSAVPNRGVVWRRAVGDIPLFSTLPFALFRARIERYHRPYHRAVELLLARRRERFGYSVLLDAHSMPGSVRAELVLGTLGGLASAPELRDRAIDALSSSELGVQVDHPYAGGELVRRFGRPAEGLHALQLEVSRALYMDEHRLEPWPLPKPNVPPESTAPPRVRRLARLCEGVEALLRTLGRTLEPG